MKARELISNGVLFARFKKGRGTWRQFIFENQYNGIIPVTSEMLIVYDAIGKKGKRKVQGVPQSQTAALPRPQEEEETDKSKQAQTEQTYEKPKISSVFPKRGNRNTKRTEKHKNKMTHGNRVLRFSSTFDEQSARYKWNILERAVKSK